MHDHSDVLKRVYELARLLGLHGWVFRVSPDPAEAEAWATIQIDDHDEAVISLGAKFYTATPVEKDQTLLHELCHCHSYRMCEEYEEALTLAAKLVPKDKRQVFEDYVNARKKAAHRMEERFVNRIAVLLTDVSE